MYVVFNYLARTNISTMDKIEKKTYNNFIVTQSNDLIEGNYSSNLTTLSLKVLNLIIAHINPNENYEDEPVVTIDISILKKYLGWTEGMVWNRFYKDLDDISIRLNSKPIATMWVEPEKYERVWFLSKYSLDMKRSEVSFTIHKGLIPHLTQLKQNFTSYQLINIPNLSSVYAIRIYGLLCQYLRIGNRKFALQDFKSKIGAPDKYKYNDVKKRVILPAQKQLKENTNISFDFHEIKTGRSVTALQFIIFKNTTTSNIPQPEIGFLKEYFDDTEENVAAFSDKLIDKLNAVGINPQNTTKYLALGFDIIDDAEKKAKAEKDYHNLAAYYEEKLELLSVSKPNKNAAGFLLKALKEDWKLAGTKETKEAKIVRQSRKKGKETTNKLTLQIEDLIVKKRKQTNILCEDLLKSDSILSDLYESVIENASDFMRGKMLSKKHLPIRTQYLEQQTLQQYINLAAVEQFPDEFQIVFEIQKKIDEAKMRRKKIKNEFAIE